MVAWSPEAGMATERAAVAGKDSVDEEGTAYITPTVDFLLVLAVAIQFAVLGVALLLP